MNKYNQLREEILKANKDILELKFGCKIKYKKTCSLHLSDYDYPTVAHCGGIWTIISEDCDYSLANPRYKYEIQLLDYNVFPREKAFLSDKRISEYFKIIGRDITLEDCLIAWEKKYPDLKTGEAMNNLWSLYCEWKPNKPFQDQSNECKDLLWDLICKK